MKTVPIEELRRHLGQMLKGEEPSLITRYGKPAGVFYPLPDAKKVRADASAKAALPRKRGAKASGDATLELPLDFAALQKAVRKD